LRVCDSEKKRLYMSQIIPAQMKRVLDDLSYLIIPQVDNVFIDRVACDIIRVRDAMEDFLDHILYIGRRTNIVYRTPLCTPKVGKLMYIFFCTHILNPFPS